MPTRNSTRLLASVLCPVLQAAIAPSVPAQPPAPGTLDLSFDPGSGINGPVNAILVQPDGKVIIGGTMNMVRGVPCHNVARLNADGSGDKSFTLGENWWLLGIGTVLAVAMQPDGKILVGHNNGLIRLNPDGHPDKGFIPPTLFPDGPAPSVSWVAVQPDGRILIGGSFFVVVVNDTLHSGIARLNADGSLDRTFDPGPDQGAGQLGGGALALEPNGKVLVAGLYSLGNDKYIQGIYRLEADGALDRSFNPGSGPETGPDAGIISIALAPDGKVLICGQFRTFNGTMRPYVARLHGDPAPGSRFLRGDCNDDGNVDLADAVCILDWLFRGGATPGCVAATNTDGVGAVDITDPIYLLTHLFRGGPAPVAPYPACGTGTLPGEGDEGTCKTPPENCPP